jgi:hypothetical protein
MLKRHGLVRAGISPVTLLLAALGLVQGLLAASEAEPILARASGHLVSPSDDCLDQRAFDVEQIGILCFANGQMIFVEGGICESSLRVLVRCRDDGASFVAHGSLGRAIPQIVVVGTVDGETIRVVEAGVVDLCCGGCILPLVEAGVGQEIAACPCAVD